MANVVKIADFTGGLNLGEPTTIDDNQLAVASNVYYDNQGILSTRRGIDNFGNEIAGATGIHTIYFTQFTNDTRILLCGQGANVRRYNEATSNWDIIQAGLNGSNLSFVTYKNFIYWTNGTDAFSGYDGTTVTTYAAIARGRYLVVQNDVGYMAGFTTDPSLVIYTPANPASLNAGFTAGTFLDELVNQDEGIITGLSTLGHLAVVGKSTFGGKRGGSGVYTLDIFTNPVEVRPVDFDGEVTSHRSMVKVENDLMFMSQKGFYSLAQRTATTGSYRAIPFTAPIQNAVDRINDKSTVVTYYSRGNNNVYLSANLDGGTVNDRLLVYSTLVSIPAKRKFVWTEYNNINANDFTEYIDAAGDTFLLVAPTAGGQVFSMENGFDDEGLEIRTQIRTKTFDFSSPEMWKTFPHVDMGGLISENETVRFYIDVDGVETNRSFTGTAFAIGDDAADLPLGEEDLGEDVLGGGPVAISGLTFFPFVVRRAYYTTGQRIRIRIETDSLNSGLKFTKLNIPIIPHDVDVFPNSFITT